MICKQDFICKKPEINYIKNYVNQSPSDSPLAHVFREVNQSKWLGKAFLLI